MNFNNVNFPLVEWLSSQKKISEVVENPFALGPVKGLYDQVIREVFYGKKLEITYVAQSILEVIDLDDKNVKALASMRLRDEKESKAGIFLYRGQNQILYYTCTPEEYFSGLGIATVPKEFWEEHHEKQEHPFNPSRYFLTFAFVGSKFYRASSGFVGTSTNTNLVGYSTVNAYLNSCLLFPEVASEHFGQYFELVDDFHLFRQYADIDLKIVKGKSGESFINIKYSNSTSKNIKVYDSTFFTTLIKTGEFGVKGHFRWQAHGEGKKDRKLIWINDFKKDGYTRIAKKLNYI